MIVLYSLIGIVLKGSFRKSLESNFLAVPSARSSMPKYVAIFVANGKERTWTVDATTYKVAVRAADAKAKVGGWKLVEEQKQPIALSRL